jgi:hypothetical protein
MPLNYFCFTTYSIFVNHFMHLNKFDFEQPYKIYIFNRIKLYDFDTVLCIFHYQYDNLNETFQGDFFGVKI